MKAVVYDRPRSISVREVPDPVPGPNQVLVRIEMCGSVARTPTSTPGRFFSEYR
jgi:D-arabinose 1-dehydrogenase-like Zn-dependent alcohol dehydrogenase